MSYLLPPAGVELSASFPPNPNVTYLLGKLGIFRISLPLNS